MNICGELRLSGEDEPLSEYANTPLPAAPAAGSGSGCGGGRSCGGPSPAGVRGSCGSGSGGSRQRCGGRYPAARDVSDDSSRHGCVLAASGAATAADRCAEGQGGGAEDGSVAAAPGGAASRGARRRFCCFAALSARVCPPNPHRPCAAVPPRAGESLHTASLYFPEK